MSWRSRALLIPMVAIRAWMVELGLELNLGFARWRVWRLFSVVNAGAAIEIGIGFGLNHGGSKDLGFESFAHSSCRFPWFE